MQEQRRQEEILRQKEQNENKRKEMYEKDMKRINDLKEVDKMDQDNNNEEDFENYDDEFLTTSVSELNGVFYKLKKINQIKDNLSNIQDDCLGYHEKLRDTLKRSQSARPQLRKELSEKEDI